MGISHHKDPALINLIKGASEWWNRFLNCDRPCWLVLVGSSETGKTHVLDWIWKEAKHRGLTHAFKASFNPRRIWWPDFVNQLRAGNAYEEIADVRSWPLLAVDEIGASRDTTGFISDQLYFMLAQRERKWTVLTSNLTMEQFTKMDERITSRALRNDGVLIEVKTVPYGSRKP